MARQRASRLSCQLALLACAVLLLLGAPRTQTRLELPFDGDAPEVQRLAASVRAVPGMRAAGGYGFVAVDLHNPGPDAHEVRIEARATWGQAFDATRTLRLAARESSRCFLPLPGLYALELRFSVDGYRDSRTMRTILSAATQQHRILAVTDRSHLGSELADWLRTGGGKELAPPPAAGRRASPPAPIDCQYLRAEDLPDRPELLTGFQLVLVAAPAEGLTAERQRLLCDLVRVGGSLLVDGLAALGPGPLREALEDAGDGRAQRLGLGHVLVLPESGGLGTRSGVAELASWVAANPAIGLPFLYRSTLGNPLPRSLQRPLEIPGLGDVPVRVFFLIVFAFCLLVGPLNHFWLRKRLGRPLLILVTVPALGFTFTLLILAYGLLADGFGIKGVARSITLLDQQKHEAVVVAGRTLYAGFGPDVLRPQPGTFLASWGSGSPSSRLSLDLDRGTVGGGLVPSRTPSHLTTATVAPARERLRFQRLGEGGLAMLSAPELVPQQLVLCDFEGVYWQLEAGGRLARLAAAAAGASLRKLGDSLGDVPIGQSAPRFDPDEGGEDPRLQATTGSLRPGSYLARVALPPAFDTLGLDVRWLAGCHLVVGTLAREDIVD